MPRLAEVVAAVERLYDPRLAEPWDAVGLVCGDPDAEVDRVLFTVDPAATTAAEAIEWGADLIVAHHPLFLRPVHGVAATTPKGRVVHTLISNGVGLHVAHTNADSAVAGVNDALADRLGLTDLQPLAPRAAESYDKLVVFVPEPAADRMLDALSAAGAGTIGEYDRSAWTTVGNGTFRPGALANPTIGRSGQIEVVRETRLEMVLPRRIRTDVVRALRAAHPYEEPAFDVFEVADQPCGTGLGRIGMLAAPEPLSTFLRRVAHSLPATAGGVRATGRPDAPIRTVAVCGGAGDSLLDDVRRAGVDAYVTADLRHHPTIEAVEAGGPALVDVSHWASEWPWLDTVAERLTDMLAEQGTTVETRVSVTPTDPWTLHESSRARGVTVLNEGGTPESRS